MPRRVQDIVPGDRRSIRNISLEKKAPRGGDRAIKITKKDEEAEKEEMPVPARTPSSASASASLAPSSREIPIRRIPITPPPLERERLPGRMSGAAGGRTGRGGRGKWLLIIVGIVVLVAGAAWVASAYFSRATFTIIPKAAKVTPDGTYVAQATAGGPNVLVYELASVSGTASTTVPATDGQQVSSKATGPITVYNAFSTTTQRLVAGTRFSDSSGRIYRTTSSLVIPGYKTSGGTVVPGSVGASVIADKPGEEYNLFKADAAGDLKIVAYKGTPKYDKMYGRLAGDIAGGFVGTKKVISPAAMEAATASLKSTLTAGLLAQIKNSIPEGYIMYDSLNVPTFSKPVIGGTNPSVAELSMKGTITGILLKKDQLATRLAGEQAVKAFGDFSFETPGIEGLSVSIANAKDFSTAKKNTLLLKIKGEMMLVGAIPVDKIKSDLAGASLAQTQELLRPYSQVIDKGSGELIPPWSKVPTDPDRITVVIEEPAVK